MSFHIKIKNSLQKLHLRVGDSVFFCNKMGRSAPIFQLNPHEESKFLQKLLQY